MNTEKSSGLAALQTLFLFIVAFISVISKPRLLLLEINQQTNIPIEFRALLLSLPDFFVLGLLLVTVVRLLAEDVYRQHLSETLSLVLLRFGGWIWAALVGWMVVGLLWAPEPALHRFSTLHALAVLAMAFILADLVRERGIGFMLWGLLISAVIQALVAIFQVINSGPLGWWGLGEIDRFEYETTAFYRAPGLSMHPNYLGGYFVIALFACVLVARSRLGQRKSIVIPAAIAVLCLVGMVATLSRSAMLSTLIGLTPLVIVWLLHINKRLRPLIIGGVAAGLLALAVWGWLVLSGNVQARLLAPREFFFTYSWDVIREAPILGVGAGNLMIAVGQNMVDYVPHLLPVHNVYLYLWAELGLPGLALLLLGCFSMLRYIRVSGDLLVWGCCFLAVCVIMLFDNYWWAVHPFRVLFFWVIGLWWGMVCRSVVLSPAATALQGRAAPPL